MSQFLRLTLCVLVAVVLFSTSTVVLAKLGSRHLEEKLDLLRWTSMICDEMRRHDYLEEHEVLIIRCSEEKHRLVQELIAHHLTLREVLGQFRELDEAVVEAAPDKEPQTPLDESTVRHHLLNWLRKELADQPSVETDLEHELADLPLIQ